MATQSEPATSAEFVPSTDELLYERRGAVAYLTFNRPQARNALTWAMYEGLYDACEHVENDERVRVFVLSGAGDKAFVSGTDISQFKEFSSEQHVLDYEARINRVNGRLENLKKPTIALIRGACTGGGAGVAMVCDLRYATPDSRFGVPVAKTLGNLPGTQNLARLVALIGPARTKELMFTARLASAQEAKSLGLFNDLFEPDQIAERVDSIAQDIAGNAPLTIRATKEVVRRVQETGRITDATDMLTLCYLSEDFKEGYSAFLEKRAPSWKGR